MSDAAFTARPDVPGATGARLAERVDRELGRRRNRRVDVELGVSSPESIRVFVAETEIFNAPPSTLQFQAVGN